MVRFKPAGDVRVGEVLDNGFLAALHVAEIGSNGLGQVVLRCGFTPGTHPSVSLSRDPQEQVAVRTKEKMA